MPYVGILWLIKEQNIFFWIIFSRFYMVGLVFVDGGEGIAFLDFFDTGISNWLRSSPICLGYLVNTSWRLLFPYPIPAPENTVLSCPDWSQAFPWTSDHPVSAFWELGLEPCATTPSFPRNWNPRLLPSPELYQPAYIPSLFHQFLHGAFGGFAVGCMCISDCCVFLVSW